MRKLDISFFLFWARCTWDRRSYCTCWTGPDWPTGRKVAQDVVEQKHLRQVALLVLEPGVCVPDQVTNILSRNRH